MQKRYILHNTHAENLCDIINMPQPEKLIYNHKIINNDNVCIIIIIV